MTKQQIIDEVEEQLTRMPPGRRTGISIPRIAVPRTGAVAGGTADDLLPKERVKLAVTRCGARYVADGHTDQLTARDMADWLLTAINGIIWTMAKGK